jgi:hypothetical protein
MIAARQGIIAKQGSASPYVDITLYSSQGTTGLNGYNVYYSTALCSGWSDWYSAATASCPNSATCAQYGPAKTILSNTTVYITVKECTATFIQFNAADDTDTCPANEGNYCYNYDECTGTAFSFNSGNVNKNIAIKVYVFSGKDDDSYALCG